jgi:DNA-binding transcriptional LysR family regulator
VQLTEAIIELVKSGLGISVLARWAVKPYLKSGELAALSLTRKGFYRNWRAVLRKDEPAPNYIMEFIRLLASKSMPALKASEGAAAGMGAKQGLNSLGAKKQIQKTISNG